MYTNVSNEFLTTLARPSRHFAARFTYGNEVIPLEVSTINAVTGTCGSEQLMVGCAFASYIDVVARGTNTLLEGKELFLEIGLLLDDNSYEYVPFGYWTVQKPTNKNNVLWFTAVDRIASKMNEAYETELTYPTSMANVISELATKAGVIIHCNLQTSVQMYAPIDSVTQRGALAIIAATLLANAWCDRNGEIWITKIGSESPVAIDYDNIKEIPDMDEQLTTISGVKVYTVRGQTDSWITTGQPHMIEVSDAYLSETILNTVSGNVVGLEYGGGEVSFMGNPLLDPSDMIQFHGRSGAIVEYMLVTHADEEIVTDGDNNIVVADYLTYAVPCMQISQSFDGGLLTTVTAPGSFEVTESTIHVGAITEELERQSKNITETREIAEDAADAADAAQTTANTAVLMANGKNRTFFQTTEPTSGMIGGDMWFDTNGGNALYEYSTLNGWTLRQFGQGSIAANSVTAVEINVSNLSAISALLGGVTVGGVNNVDGYIVVTDASGNEVGRWNNQGIDVKAGQIGVWTIDTSGIRYNTAQSSKHALVYKDGIEFYDGSGYCSIWGSNNTAYHAYFGDTQSNEHVWINSSTGNRSNAYTNINAGEISLAKQTATQTMGLVTATIEDYNASIAYGGMALSKLSGSTLTNTISLVGYDGAITASGTISAKKFQADIGSTVAPLIENVYNSTSYPLVRSHNNGNISISASSGGLYLGWENTTGLYSTLVWTSTTTSAANVVVDGVGKLGRSTSSSKRYKHDIKALEDYKKVLEIPVVSFVYNTDYVSETDIRFGKAIPGFIAEDVFECYPIATELEDGEPEDWNPRYIIPPMLAVEKEHEKRIEELEKENARLKAEIEAIKKAIGIGE